MKVVKCIKHDELLVEFESEFGVPYEVVISYHTGQNMLCLVMEKRGYKLEELISVSV